MERGIVDAVPLNLPLNRAARKLGFRELVNYEKLGITYPSNTVTTLRQTVRKKPELIERFLKTLRKFLLSVVKRNGLLTPSFP